MASPTFDYPDLGPTWGAHGVGTLNMGPAAKLGAGNMGNIRAVSALVWVRIRMIELPTWDAPKPRVYVFAPLGAWETAFRELVAQALWRGLDAVHRGEGVRSRPPPGGARRQAHRLRGRVGPQRLGPTRGRRASRPTWRANVGGASPPSFERLDWMRAGASRLVTSGLGLSWRRPWRGREWHTECGFAKVSESLLATPEIPAS